FAALLLGFALLAGGLLAARQSARAWDEAEMLLRARLDQIEGVLSDARTLAPATLDARVARLASAGGLRLTLVDSDGRVLADSHERAASLDNHGQRPEILAARTAGEGWSLRFSQSL